MLIHIYLGASFRDRDAAVADTDSCQEAPIKTGAVGQPGGLPIDQQCLSLKVVSKPGAESSRLFESFHNSMEAPES